MSDAEKAACDCTAKNVPVYGLDASMHNKDKPQQGVQDLRTKMVARFNETIDAVRAGMARGRPNAIRALVVHLMLIEHAWTCPYITVMRQNHPTYFGVALAEGDAGSSDDELEVTIGTSQLVGNAPAPAPLPPVVHHAPRANFVRGEEDRNRRPADVGVRRGNGLGKGLSASQWA